MTTPTTPAADAVSLDNDAPTMRDWIVTLEHAHDESLDDLHTSARSILRGVISEMKEHEATATARESALVAERDRAQQLADSYAEMVKTNQALIEGANVLKAQVVAERDALRADMQRLMDKHNALHVNAHAVRVVAVDLLAACQVAFDQTCSVGRPKDWHQINAAINKARDCAALSATAVEGE